MGLDLIPTTTTTFKIKIIKSIFAVK